MPSITVGSLVKELRERKSLLQTYLQDFMILSEEGEDIVQVLSLLENRHRHSHQETAEAFLDGLDLPIETFLCPNSFVMRDQLFRVLDRMETDGLPHHIATDLIMRLESMLEADSVIIKQSIMVSSYIT